MNIRLTNYNGSLFAEVKNWEAANIVAKSVIKKGHSDLYYFIEFDDKQEASGSIDLEPRSFHGPHINNIVTWHLKTFWGNCAKQVPNWQFSKEDIQYFNFLLTKIN